MKLFLFFATLLLLASCTNSPQNPNSTPACVTGALSAANGCQIIPGTGPGNGGDSEGFMGAFKQLKQYYFVPHEKHSVQNGPQYIISIMGPEKTSFKVEVEVHGKLVTLNVNEEGDNYWEYAGEKQTLFLTTPLNGSEIPELTIQPGEKPLEEQEEFKINASVSTKMMNTATPKFFNLILQMGNLVAGRLIETQQDKPQNP